MIGRRTCPRNAQKKGVADKGYAVIHLRRRMVGEILCNLAIAITGPILAAADAKPPLNS